MKAAPSLYIMLHIPLAKYTEAIQVLVANGALPYASNGTGPSAMEAAEGDDLIVPLLLEGRDAHVLGGEDTGADETGRWV